MRPWFTSQLRLVDCRMFLQAIGYDMDYTLAQYKPDTFEGLAHKVRQNAAKACSKYGIYV